MMFVHVITSSESLSSLMLNFRLNLYAVRLPSHSSGHRKIIWINYFQAYTTYINRLLFFFLFLLLLLLLPLLLLYLFCKLYRLRHFFPVLLCARVFFYELDLQIEFVSKKKYLHGCLPFFREEDLNGI